MGNVMKDSEEAFTVADLLALQATEMARGQTPALGGRGFNSSRRSRPATAPILMRRFFSCAKTFDYFSGNQTIKPRSPKIMLVKQCRPTSEAVTFEHLFSPAQDALLSKKNVAKFPGGHDSFF